MSLALSPDEFRRADDPVALFERHRARLLRTRRAWTLGGLAVFAVLLTFSVAVSNFFPDRLAAGLPRIGSYIYDTLPVLRWPLLLENSETEGSIAYWYFNLPSYLRLLFETINMALFSTLFGALFALLLCFPASRNLAPNRLAFQFARRLAEICRSVPEVVFALLFVYAVGVGPLAGILAIIIHSTGALAKLFSEVNENCDDKPIEGVRSVGGNWFEEMRYGVAPQVLPNFVSYALLRFEINVRASAILGFVGAGGIGQELYYVIQFNHYEEVSAIVLLIVLTVTVVDLLSERIRGRLIGREAA